ncbi:hypothetical protein CSC67_02155 [Pusillimonas caeni]|uniref:hypothetical protein n=1 Tax=Pusillimonas caeni TaxID=1348472 RepID=UPI000E5A0598|nr:hypothetical protein [Pusillimonas caeni]TFL15552.1 hypothetical protein CSC67_02155 [Pusillimonas caeni]
MQLFQSTRPSAEEHAALLAELGPLPIQGQAWPSWVKIMVWIVVAAIGVQLVRVAVGFEGEPVNPFMAASVLICFCGLLLIARVMAISTTRITRDGIEQTWITKRAIGWQDIQFAKFVPMLASKRLICFTGRSRPVIFQSGTPELHVAFAKIAMVYRRR